MAKYITKLRRGIKDDAKGINEWAKYEERDGHMNPLDGELVLEYDNGVPRLKIGKDDAPFSELPYMSIDSFILPKQDYVTLLTDWHTDDGDRPYQEVVVEGGVAVTPNSKIDLQPTPEQLSIFHEKDLTFVAENNNGVVHVYCIGQIPQNTYEIPVTVTEVVATTRPIIGNTTATPNPRPDWAQMDETKADYIKNKPNVVIIDDYDLALIPNLTVEGEICVGPNDEVIIHTDGVIDANQSVHTSIIVADREIAIGPNDETIIQPSKANFRTNAATIEIDAEDGSISLSDVINGDGTDIRTGRISTPHIDAKSLQVENQFAVGLDSSIITKSSVAIGDNVSAGCKGYYIQAVDFDTSTLYLTDKHTDNIYNRNNRLTTVYCLIGDELKTDEFEGADGLYDDSWWQNPDFDYITNVDYEVGDEVSLLIYGFRTQTQKVGSFHYNLLTTISAIDNGKITLAMNPLPFTSLIPVSSDYKWYSSFMVPSRPNIGAVELMVGATALGGNTNATGEYSLAEGSGTTTAGAYGHSEGRDTVAVYAAHSEGVGTQALAMASHTEGEGTVATGVRAHAQGYYTIAASAQQHVWGKFNIPDSEGKYAHIVGGGTHYADDKRKNIHTLDWSGNAWFAGDVIAKVNGDEISLGGVTIKVDEASKKAISAQNTADAANEKAIAAQNTAAIVYKRPGGVTVIDDVIYGDAMNREGGNTASGRLSFAAGYHSEATMQTAIAMGNNAKATADYAVAIGQSAVSNGTGSVSIGYGNIVESTATSSFVTGWNSTIAGRHSAAIGNYVQTKHENQIALGTYNDATNADDIFMIGNGTSALRKNIFVVNKDGEGYLDGKKILVEGAVVVDTYTKEETDAKIGDIDSALDKILAIQESLIGGNV